MIKKIVLGFSFMLVVGIVVVAGYIFQAHTPRPAAQPATSIVLDAEYARASDAAVKWMEDIYAHHLVPSVSVAVGMHGRLVWQGAIGYSDLNNLIPATEDTRYRIGSIAKPMTAVVALRLQEQGRLNIEQPFSAYVKDFSETHGQITLKQLLSHQAGVRHYINDIGENFNTTEYASTRAAAAIVEHDALLFPPGEGFHYTTYGYTLLALAMEQAARRPFEQLMNDELFSPLHLGATRLNKAGHAVGKEISVPYLELGDALYRSPEPNVSNKYAGGGILSTPTDLVQFAHALLDDALLSKESRELLWTTVPLANGDRNPENYALGFRIGEDELGKFVHHGGKSVGGFSFLLIYPEQQWVVALTINSTPGDDIFDRQAEAKKLVRLFLEQ